MLSAISVIQNGTVTVRWMETIQLYRLWNVNFVAVNKLGVRVYMRVGMENRSRLLWTGLWILLFHIRQSIYWPHDYLLACWKWRHSMDRVSWLKVQDVWLVFGIYSVYKSTGTKSALQWYIMVFLCHCRHIYGQYLKLAFRPHCGPGVDSASNRNEYQKYFLGGKGGRC
jgi:hypothetical protein